MKRAFAIVITTLMIALGWVAPNADTMISHARIAWELASDRGVDLLRKVWPFFSTFEI